MRLYIWPTPPIQGFNSDKRFWPDFHLSKRFIRWRVAGPRRLHRLISKVLPLTALTALITKRQHALMPLLVLGMGSAEPPPTRRAAYGRRVSADRIAR
jgi:hypothetical protein